MVSEQTIAKYATELINRYVAQYEKKYGRAPKINRNQLKWGFRDMAVDLGKMRAGEVIDFYFELPRSPHEPNNLLYNYDKLDQAMEELAEDEARRLKIRQETLERVQAWQSQNSR
jgi:hypothetical protein